MKLRTNDGVSVPITSMIDVVFLLIIFFVVTTVMESDAVDHSIALAESNYVEPDPEQNPLRVVIDLGLKSDGTYRFAIAGEAMTSRELSATLRRSVSRHGNRIPVIVRASHNVRFEKIDEIISTLGDAGLHRIKLSTHDVGQH